MTELADMMHAIRPLIEALWWIVLVLVWIVLFLEINAGLRSKMSPGAEPRPTPGMRPLFLPPSPCTLSF